MKTKRLLVLDLNGTILHRLTHAFETKLFRNHPVVISKNLKPDITVHGSKIIFRPHAITFLTHVLKHFDVAVWTSSRPHNALPMVHHSFKNLLDFSSILEEAGRRGVKVRQVVLGPSDKGAELMKERLLEDTRGKAKLKFIWTQGECDTVPRNGKNTSSDTQEHISSDTQELISSETKDILISSDTKDANISNDTKDVHISNTEDGSARSSSDNISDAHININNKDNTISSGSPVDTQPSPPPASKSSPPAEFIKPIRKKDLSKIYTTFPAYSPLNTLIIDDTDAKLADHVDNHICVPEFNVTEHLVDFTLDKHLLQLKKYLDRLVKEDPEDVRTFLSTYDMEDC